MQRLVHAVSAEHAVDTGLKILARLERTASTVNRQVKLFANAVTRRGSSLKTPRSP